MTLKVYDGPPGNFTDCGQSVWVENVPADFTDADVQWNVEQWAASGDKVAIRALQMAPKTWISFGADRTVRCYLDE